MVARLGRILRVPRPFWAAGLLAAQPVFWIASAESMDFVLAALLGTWALLAARSGTPRWAGFLLGLGVATRAENAIFVLPLAALSRDGLVTRFADWQRGRKRTPPTAPFNEAARVAAWIGEKWLNA